VRGESAEDQGHGVLEGHVPRLEREGAVLTQAGVLGVPTEPRAQHADHLVAGREPRDLGPDRFDDAGDVHPQHATLRPEGPDPERGEQPQSPGHLTTAGAVVGGADGARVDPDQDVVRAHRRPRELLDPHGVRSAEAAVGRGPHRTACAIGSAATADGRKPLTVR
jgi:hypothetical protein